MKFFENKCGKVKKNSFSYVLCLFGFMEAVQFFDFEYNFGPCQFNKLTSVFHASVLLLIMNFVIILSK